MTNIDCTNPNTEIGKKYCNWIKDRGVQSCFTRDSDNDKVILRMVRLVQYVR